MGERLGISQTAPRRVIGGASSAYRATAISTTYNTSVIPLIKPRGLRIVELTTLLFFAIVMALPVLFLLMGSFNTAAPGQPTVYGIDRLERGGKSWTKLGLGIATKEYPGTIVVDDAVAGRIYAGCRNGEFYVRDNSGKSWRSAGLNLMLRTCRA